METYSECDLCVLSLATLWSTKNQHERISVHVSASRVLLFPMKLAGWKRPIFGITANSYPCRRGEWTFFVHRQTHVEVFSDRSTIPTILNSWSRRLNDWKRPRIPMVRIPKRQRSQNRSKQRQQPAIQSRSFLKPNARAIFIVIVLPGLWLGWWYLTEYNNWIYWYLLWSAHRQGWNGTN